MIGMFACPECGSRVMPRAGAAGLRVRCPGCGTLVAIPYLPRAVRGRRGRHARWGWGIAGAGVAVAVLMIVLAVATARSRGRASRWERLGEHLDAVARAEGDGRLEQALSEADEAVAVARELGGEPLASARSRRDDVALKDVEARLARLAGGVGALPELRELRRRVDADPALAPMRGAVFEALAQAESRRASADLVEASGLLGLGHTVEALNLCERVVATCDDLGRERSEQLRDEAIALVREIASRVGVVFEPVRGEFLAGPQAATGYAEEFRPVLASALRARGYLPKPDRPAFAEAWDEAAPYRVSVEVIERNDGTFFQTPLHTTRLNAHVALIKGQTTLWQVRPKGQTRVPPPSMSAFESSRLSLAKVRDPDAERRLYDDARLVLMDGLLAAAKNLPAPSSSPPAS